MATINIKAILELASKSERYKQRMVETVDDFVEQEKMAMVEEFENHPVTQELKAGPEAHGSSFLPDGYGNLFSFIGFYAGDDPTAEVENELIKRTGFFEKKLHNTRYVGNNRVSSTVNINIPDLDVLYEITEYPDGWRDGSWLKGIAKGIPGFQSYIFDEKFGSYSQSRSQMALQAKKRNSNTVVILRNGAYKPTAYIEQIIKKFISRIK